jgi:hypothetical protein
MDAYNPQSGCSPYGMGNSLVADHTTTANGQKMHAYLKRNSNMNVLPNLMYIVYQFPSYINSIMSSYPLHVKLLSFLDIGMHIESRN